MKNETKNKILDAHKKGRNDNSSGPGRTGAVLGVTAATVGLVAVGVIIGPLFTGGAAIAAVFLLAGSVAPTQILGYKIGQEGMGLLYAGGKATECGWHKIQKSFKKDRKENINETSKSAHNKTPSYMTYNGNESLESTKSKSNILL